MMDDEVPSRGNKDSVVSSHDEVGRGEDKVKSKESGLGRKEGRSGLLGKRSEIVMLLIGQEEFHSISEIRFRNP